MAWEKSPRALVELFDECLPTDPRIERRQMFGYPAAFVHGNMFAGLFQDQVIARLPANSPADMDAAHGAIPFEPMPGRVMRAYAVMPEAVVIDDEALAKALRHAFAYAASLPPKEKKAKSRGKPRSAAS